MSISPTEATTPTPATPPPGLFTPPASTDATSSGGTTSGTGSLSDKNTFLQLLVAQLKYQDPMNPTDSSQFLSQTAQFNALEQMQQVAQQTAALVTQQAAFGATSLVGRQVSYTNSDGTTAAGLVSGVHYSANGPLLTIGGTDIALSQVQSVTAPKASDPSSAPPATQQ